MTIAVNLRDKTCSKIHLRMQFTEMGFIMHKPSVIAAASVAEAINGLKKKFDSVDELL